MNLGDFITSAETIVLIAGVLTIAIYTWVIATGRHLSKGPAVAQQITSRLIKPELSTSTDLFPLSMASILHEGSYDYSFDKIISNSFSAHRYRQMLEELRSFSIECFSPKVAPSAHRYRQMLEELRSFSIERFSPKVAPFETDAFPFTNLISVVFITSHLLDFMESKSLLDLSTVKERRGEVRVIYFGSAISKLMPDSHVEIPFSGHLQTESLESEVEILIERIMKLRFKYGAAFDIAFKRAMESSVSDDLNKPFGWHPSIFVVGELPPSHRKK